MNGIGLNKSSIRNLNRVIFYVSKLENSNLEEDSELTFALFTKGGIEFSIQSTVGENFIGSTLNKWSPQLAMIGNIASSIGSGFESLAEPLKGLSELGAISYSNKGTFKGMSPISFSISGILTSWSGKGYANDVLDPLRKLLFITLPEPALGGATTNDGIKELQKLLDSWVNNVNGDNKKKAAEGVSKLLSGLASSVEASIGNIYAVTTPIVCKTNYIVSVQVGKLVFSDVLIKNISYRMPPLVSFDGYPEYIELSIQCETSRPVDTSFFQSFVGRITAKS